MGPHILGGGSNWMYMRGRMTLLAGDIVAGSLGARMGRIEVFLNP